MLTKISRDRHASTAAEFWTARAALDAANEALHTRAVMTLMRIALYEPSTVGGRATELLAQRFGARVTVE